MYCFKTIRFRLLYRCCFSENGWNMPKIKKPLENEQLLISNNPPKKTTKDFILYYILKLFVVCLFWLSTVYSVD